MGFKPETMTNKILPALGYNGPKDQKSINAFLAANPAAAAKMGKYTMAARQMVEGKPIGAATGKYTNKGKKRTGFDGGTSRADMGIGGGKKVRRETPQQMRDRVHGVPKTLTSQQAGDRYGRGSTPSTGVAMKDIPVQHRGSVALARLGKDIFGRDASGGGGGRSSRSAPAVQDKVAFLKTVFRVISIRKVILFHLAALEVHQQEAQHQQVVLHETLQT